jgi:hypothetical protein
VGALLSVRKAGGWQMKIWRLADESLRREGEYWRMAVESWTESL